ncbi:MAG TPA: DUF3501 family protein [Steroidobacteraceae bacterium]|jgi:hypothetical protein|nr:DUF3501 family protein [Steroidobacteraceae bacterium]
MRKLTPDDLMSLERYARERNAFRARVMQHKSIRQLAVGPHVRWCFEDRLTIQYQLQEMLRTERIFESEGIAAELETYNPLIPDGGNWKVTLLIEFPDPEERRVQLARLKGVEDGCWIEVAGAERVFALADEDLERENEEKTSSVHFLRFEVSATMQSALRGAAALAVGVEHPAYQHRVDVPEAVRRALLADFA